MRQVQSEWWTCIQAAMQGMAETSLSCRGESSMMQPGTMRNEWMPSNWPLVQPGGGEEDWIRLDFSTSCKPEIPHAIT